MCSARVGTFDVVERPAEASSRADAAHGGVPWTGTSAPQLSMSRAMMDVIKQSGRRSISCPLWCGSGITEASRRAAFHLEQHASLRLAGLLDCSVLADGSF